MPVDVVEPRVFLPLGAAVGANGLKAWTDGILVIVADKLLLLLSTKRFDWQVRSAVQVTAVSADVGGVNEDPNAVDLQTRKYLQFMVDAMNEKAKTSNP